MSKQKKDIDNVDDESGKSIDSTLDSAQAVDAEFGQPGRPVGCSDEGDGSEKRIPNEADGLDWSTEGMLNHPDGIDAAITINNARMLEKTKQVIESGSLEDIAAALEENTRQLQLLHDRMQNLFKIMQ
jgi:hypothetical protein